MCSFRMSVKGQVQSSVTSTLLQILFVFSQETTCLLQWHMQCRHGISRSICKCFLMSLHISSTLHSAALFLCLPLDEVDDLPESRKPEEVEGVGLPNTSQSTSS